MTKHFLWNMCSNIRNGQLAKKSVIKQKRKFICESCLKILWNEGLIIGYRISLTKKNHLEIFLKYTSTGQPAIRSLRPISKPSKRIYCSLDQIWKMNASKMFIIFSTNKGLLTTSQCKEKKIGGEALFAIN